MPIISFANPKGGAGKTTSALLLAGELAGKGARIVIIDADPERWITQWGRLPGKPDTIGIVDDVSEDSIVDQIEKAAASAQFVIVDLEGVASQLVSRAISQADLVIVPMQPTALDAEIGSEALALVREEEEALGRPIRHAVVLTKTNAAVRSRVQKELETQLSDAGIDLIQPALVNRAAFSELFAYGGDLTDMAADATITTGGNIEKAQENARSFAEAVYDRLK